MAERRIEIDPDIRRAQGPPGELYHDPYWFELQKRTVFPRTWHFATREEGLDSPGRVRPFVLLEGCLDEPLLLVRDSRGELHGLSNVCTHRGNLVVEGEWTVSTLRCRYHGRRFHLDGTFAYMPAFEGCEHFPGDADYLPRVPIAAWRGLVFASLRPAMSPAAIVEPMERRLAGLPQAEWRLEAEAQQEREVEANWVLVMEALLDGFHIPFVHGWRRSEGERDHPYTETWQHGSVRVEEAAQAEDAFDLPVTHPDGERVAAWHFGLFPTTVLSVYPWGLWLNAVRPLGPERTRIRTLAFVADRRRLAHNGLESLFRELAEDQDLLPTVQRGVRSRLYRGGRYSPTAEQSVHHFHRLLAASMTT